MSAGIATVTRQWSRDTGLRASVRIDGENPELPADVKRQLVQITREALANVAKHAYSENVWVELQCSPVRTTLRVRDDGRGFSAPDSWGHGMGIMRERAAMAGASVEIKSKPGEGTEVLVAYPSGLQGRQ